MIRIDGPVAALPIQPPAAGPQADETAAGSFGDVLTEALSALEETQQTAAQASLDLVSGRIQDLSQVVIASEKATLALELFVEVRNKVLEAYQEVMRMTV